jgi:hypothetical protein
MRWFVDVSSVGKGGERRRYCVEADTWQKGLQATRGLRDDPGPMTGFSIEVQDDGFSAVDPIKRVKYVIRKTTDAEAVTSDDNPPEILPPERSMSSRPPPASQPPGPDGVPKSRSSRPPAPDLNLAPKSTKGKAKGLTPAPSRVDAAPTSATVRSEAPRPSSIPRAEPDSPPIRPLEVLAQRAENPGPGGPLTYREFAYLVEGTPSNDDAARILREQLEGVKQSIAAAGLGKLVNLAIFTTRFTGRPSKPPFATLTWKDWKGEAVVAFPDPNAPRVSNVPPTVLPASAQAIVSAPPPAAAPAPASVAPAPATVATTPSVAPAPASVAPAPATVAATPSVAPAPASVAPAPASVAPAPAVAVAPAPAAVVTPPEPAPPPPAAPVPGPNQVVASQPPASAPPSDTIPARTKSGAVTMIGLEPAASIAQAAAATAAPVAPVIAPAPATVVDLAPPAAPVSAPPDTAPTVGAPESAPSSTGPDSLAPATTRAPATPVPAAPAPRPRLRGDELIADLFESMHDLQFLQDAVEGADFCLTLAFEKMPASGGIVHLYDIDRREFVVTCAGGPGGEGLLLQRNSEKDPVLGPTMRKRKPLVLADATTHDHARSTPRYVALGGAKSLIVAPVVLGGRFLGAIELLNPIDGVPFTDDDGYALGYIAEQLANFVAERGIVLDRNKSVPPPAPAAAPPAAKSKARGARAR